MTDRRPGREEGQACTVRSAATPTRASMDSRDRRRRHRDPAPAAVPECGGGSPRWRRPADRASSARRDRAVQPRRRSCWCAQGVPGPAGRRGRPGPAGPAGGGARPRHRLCRDRGARGRAGDPRPAARAGRGGLLALRQRVPGVRLAGGLRGGDRAAAGRAGRSRAGLGGAASPGPRPPPAAAQGKASPPVVTITPGHRPGHQPITRQSEGQQDDGDRVGAPGHETADAGRAAQRQGAARSSAATPRPACTRTTR